MDESSNLSAPTHSPGHNSSNEKIEDAPNTSTASNEKIEDVPNTSTASNGHTQPTTSNVPHSSHAKKPSAKTADSHGKSKNPTKSSASNFENRKMPHPESTTFKITQEMMKQEGATKWDKSAAKQLEEFMFQLSGQLLDHAKSASEHRESSIVEFDDVTEAVDSFNKTFRTDKLEVERRLKEAAERLNGEPLPKIRSEVGIHAPNDRFMAIHPDYRVTEEHQRRVEYKPVSTLMGNRAMVHSNVYSSAIVGQTFKNPMEDTAEYD